MDLEAYISRYEPNSETRIQRLLFIGRNAPSADLATQAYNLLETQLKEMGNWKRYSEVFSDCPVVEGDGDDVNMQDVDASPVNHNANANANTTNATSTNSNKYKHKHKYKHTPASLKSFTYSPSFTQTTKSASDLRLQTLTQNLSTASSCLAKESIRLSHLALAEHHRKNGDIGDALQHLFKAKELSSTGGTSGNSSSRGGDGRLEGMTASLEDGTRSTTSFGRTGGTTHVVGQMARIYLQILPCALDAKNYDMVHRLDYERTRTSSTNTNTNTNTLNNNTEDGSSSWYAAQFQCAVALSHLSTGNYRAASHTFVSLADPLPAAPPSVSQECIGSSLSAMLSPEDVALYGGLTSLATMSRNEMSWTLDRMEVFREGLECVPPLRDAIRRYVDADYGACLKLLEGCRGDWGMDMYLGKHADVIWSMVRDECMVQYCVPYTSVSLEGMMESFGFFGGVEEMEDAVADLIERRKIVGARIDGVSGTLNVMSVRALERKERRLLMRKIGKVGDGLLREMEGTLVRMSCVENDIYVDDKSVGGGGGIGVRSSRRNNRSSWRDSASADISSSRAEGDAMIDDMSDSSGDRDDVDPASMMDDFFPTP